MEKQKIKFATSHQEIDALVEEAASARNLKLDASMPYGEQAEFYREDAAGPVKLEDALKMAEMADLLDIAETKWFELS